MLQSALPFFPAELEREIFETAAMYHGDIPTLLRVARRVFVWIEPLLYRVVRVWDRNSLHALSRAIESKPTDFFKKCVRHLSLELGLPMGGDAVRILGVCTGIVDLALDEHMASPKLLPVMATMSLQMLSVHLDFLFGGAIELAHPAFTYLTHLDVMDFGDSAAETLILAQLPALHALTHLALDHDVRPNAMQALLEQCPYLELGLSLWMASEQDDYRSAQHPHIYDVRFVIGYCSGDYYWASWEASALGRPNLWSLGDDFVARKRRGEIEATCYWLPTGF
ncbi:hypothetical protein C8R47DRAFT_186290 [Mycena vitilis]|nr:hypothetical protein C8R47DRAFT_186290 [Mycena vitilis]